MSQNASVRVQNGDGTGDKVAAAVRFATQHLGDAKARLAKCEEKYGKNHEKTKSHRAEVKVYEAQLGEWRKKEVG